MTHNRLSPERRAAAAQRWLDGWSWERMTRTYRGVPRDTLRDICAATGARLDDLPKPRINGKPWTREEEAEMLALLAVRTPQVEIAQRLKRTLNAIRNKLDELRTQHRPPPSRTVTRRACLCCGKPFDSTGAHHRICDKCKNDDAWRNYTLREGGGVRVR